MPNTQATLDSLKHPQVRAFSAPDVVAAVGYFPSLRQDCRSFVDTSQTQEERLDASHVFAQPAFFLEVCDVYQCEQPWDMDWTPITITHGSDLAEILAPTTVQTDVTLARLKRKLHVIFFMYSISFLLFYFCT